MNYIFDFDGTICDSFDLTLQIANEYLTKLGKKPIDARQFREKGIEEIIKEYELTKIQILLYIFKGRRELAKRRNELHAFPEIIDVIKKLSRTNTLAIASSNSKKNIESFLRTNDIEECFKFVVSSPTLFNKAKKIENAINKYKLNKDETIYIGDEVRDIQAARKVGIKCIAVTWGFASENLLKKNKADYLAIAETSLLHPTAEPF